MNYFVKNNLNLYNMDCMDLMQKYPDNYFDLAIVDPPYGIGKFTCESSTDKNGKRRQKKLKWSLKKGIWKQMEWLRINFPDSFWKENIPSEEFNPFGEDDQ